MTTKMKRKKYPKRVVGDIVSISLGDGFKTYSRVLNEAMFAFYDCRTEEQPPIDTIISSSILFKVAVMKYAVTRGHWEIVGHAPLESALQNLPPKFMQDLHRPGKFRIYHQGQIRPATLEECIGLECAAVWDPIHVEDRLRDHYTGRKNKWVESLKLREPKL
jgi:hypothetical protein